MLVISSFRMCIIKLVYLFVFQGTQKTSKKLGVCVDVRGTMGTSHVWTGNPEGKGEVGAIHFLALALLTVYSCLDCAINNSPSLWL